MDYVDSMLFGRDRHRTRRTLVLAAAVFFASLVLYTSFPIYDGLPVTYLLIVPSVPVLAGAVALISAYRNDGLLASAVVPVMAVLGLELSLALWLSFDLVPSYDPAGFGFVPVLLAAAFGIGRRRRRRRGWHTTCRSPYQFVSSERVPDANLDFLNFPRPKHLVTGYATGR